MVILGLKLSFEVFASSDKLCDFARKALRDITAYRLFNVFDPKYKEKVLLLHHLTPRGTFILTTTACQNRPKDELLLQQCDRLRDIDVSEILGLRPKLYAQLSGSPLLLQEAFTLGVAFVEESSVRAKYKALEHMSNTICNVASSALKRADGKPDSCTDSKYIMYDSDKMLNSNSIFFFFSNFN